MQYLSDTSEDAKTKFKEILYDLASGEWHKWGEKKGFRSYRSSDENKELFTLNLSEVEKVLAWERVWTINLSNKIQYSGETFDSESLESPREYSPHLVVRFLEGGTERISSGRFVNDGIIYEEFDNLIESTEEFFDQEVKEDHFRYGEELYFLSTDRIGDLLDGIQRALPLHMSEEQVDVLSIDTEGPIFVSGEAGSGKTILTTHWLMVNHLHHESKKGVDYPIPQIFVTFSERLRKDAEKKFERMLPKSAVSHRTRFLTYRNLLDEISKEAGILTDFDEKDEMDFERFMKKYAKKHVLDKLDAVLLWDEIRSVIKGSKQSGGLIDLPNYLEKEGKHGCKTPKELREDYYEAAQNYQNHLRQKGLWDQLDKVKECLRFVENAKKYEKIACDEVQDLTPIEILLLAKLQKNQNIKNLFLTGDRAQVINPSGFRWSRTKRVLGKEFGRESMPDRHDLERNYRSSKEIVELANDVLSVREEILNDRVSKLTKKSQVSSEVSPTVLHVKTSNLVKKLKNAKSDPDKRLILVKTSEEKQKVQKKLGEIRDFYTILTIEEAKGLEYDAVFLWNFFIPRHSQITENEWVRVFQPKRRAKLKEDISQRMKTSYGLTYEFNLLHVGLTRARKMLFAISEEENKGLEALLEGKDAKLSVENNLATFEKNWDVEKEPDGDDWLNAADRLLEKGIDTDQAHRFLRNAANSYEEEGELKKAADCREKAEDYDEAANLYDAAKDKKSKLRVLGIKFKKSEKLEKAVEKFKDLAELQKREGKGNAASESYKIAKDCYKELEKEGLAAEMAYNQGDSLPPEKHLDKAIKFDNAAFLYQESDDIKNAIDIKRRAVEEAKDISSSERIQGLQIDYWISQRFLEMARYWKKLNEIPKAATIANKSVNFFNECFEGELEKVIKQKTQKRNHYEKALSLSIQLYIQDNQIKKAFKRQKDFLEHLRPEGNIGTIQEYWEGFSDLYWSQKEFEEYGRSKIQVVNVLRERNQPRLALEKLRSSVERVRRLDETPRNTLVELSEKLIEIAKENREWDSVAKGSEVLAKFYKDNSNFQKSWNQYKEMGIAYIEDNKEGETIDKQFRKGAEQLKKAVKPIRLGRNFFFGIVLSGYSKKPEAYEDEIKIWLDKSVNHFVQELETSINLLESELKSRKKPETRGWIETCIALVHQKHGEISGDSSLGEKADKWFRRALSSFKEAGDEDAKNIVESLSERRAGRI